MNRFDFLPKRSGRLSVAESRPVIFGTKGFLDEEKEIKAPRDNVNCDMKKFKNDQIDQRKPSKSFMHVNRK